MRSTRLVENHCWSCNTLLDGASDLEGDKTPKEGDISICIECGSPAVFNADLTTRQPTPFEMEGIMRMPQAADYMLAIRERRMRHPQEPDAVLLIIALPEDGSTDV